MTVVTTAPGVPPRRGRTRRRLVLAGVLVLAVLVGIVLAWTVPYGSHAVVQQLDGDLQQALAGLGTPQRLDQSPEKDLAADDSFAVGVRRGAGGVVVVSAFEYRNTLQRKVWTWLLGPQRNALRWDSPGRQTFEDPPDVGLPAGSELVGFGCQEAGCERYFVWWPVGADLVLVDIRPLGLATASDATEDLGDLWEILPG